EPDALREQIESMVAKTDQWTPDGAAADIRPVRLSVLTERHLRLAEPIIDGILRRGETGNLVNAPKTNKSWMGYGVALSVATGIDWLGRFATRKSRVLLIDNELHEPTLAHRIPMVARAMG